MDTIVSFALQSIQNNPKTLKALSHHVNCSQWCTAAVLSIRPTCLPTNLSTWWTATNKSISETQDKNYSTAKHLRKRHRLLLFVWVKEFLLCKESTNQLKKTKKTGKSQRWKCRSLLFIFPVWLWPYLVMSRPTQSCTRDALMSKEPVYTQNVKLTACTYFLQTNWNISEVGQFFFPTGH